MKSIYIYKNVGGEGEEMRRSIQAQPRIRGLRNLRRVRIVVGFSIAFSMVKSGYLRWRRQSCYLP